MEDKFYNEQFYHVYFHAVGTEKLFRNEDNYHFFLQKYKYYINDVAETFAYALLPNHVHFLIKISINAINDSEDVHKHLLQYFGKLKNSYTKSYNKIFERRGSLFSETIKRKEIKDYSYFSNVVRYINGNAVHHGIVKCIVDWKYTSYSSLVSDKETLLKRDDVMSWFGSKEEFIKVHKKSLLQDSSLFIEE